MKKAVIAVALILAAVGAYGQSGVLKEMTGQVELKNPGSASFVAARAGDVVNENAVVSTGIKSTAIIQVGSALLTVRPLTRLTLTEIRASAESESMNMSLQAGRVRVDLKPPAGSKASMSVSSPSATASVRGTSFEFDTRNLQVYEGGVIFKGIRGEGTLITAGFGSGITANGSAANPVVSGAGAYRPQMPESTEAGIGAAAVPAGGEAPAPPSDDGNTDVNVTFK